MGVRVEDRPHIIQIYFILTCVYSIHTNNYEKIDRTLEHPLAVQYFVIYT